MYSKPCPVEGCDVVLRDDDMDRLIDHMKAHIKKHEDEATPGVEKMTPTFPETQEDENKMKSTAVEVIEREPVETDDDENFIPMDKPDETRIITDVRDEIVLTVTQPTNPPTPNIATALCNMQKADLGAITDSSNPFFNSKYADLSSVWGVIRKPLTGAGLSIMQYPEPFEGGITVVTRMYHVSGEMFETRLSGKTDVDKTGKATVQKMGSLITYLRRYSISMLVGVAPKDDDDGNEAAKPGSQKNRGGD